jgi:hypothetical protein
MPKNDEYVKDDLEDEIKEDHSQEHIQEHIQEHSQEDSQDQQNIVWISDIYDILYPILNKYAKTDNRLRWVRMSDIMYGYRSKYIKYDIHIKCFIEEFLDEIVKIKKSLRKKNKYIINDDKEEFERLSSLDNEQIYSRIAFCLEKKYLN